MVTHDRVKMRQKTNRALPATSTGHVEKGGSLLRVNPQNNGMCQKHRGLKIQNCYPTKYCYPINVTLQNYIYVC